MPDAPARAERTLRRDVGWLGLLFATLGSIIGAGWLFGASNAAAVAGPAAILSWLIGGGAVLLLALVHAELGAMHPVAGGSARFPEIAHGRLAGFTSGWVAFLAAVAVAPLMVEAALLYSANWIPGLAHVSGGRPVLTAAGYAAAAALLLVLCAINVVGVRWLAGVNKAVMWWKLIVPAVTVAALAGAATHGPNFGAAGGGFMPFGWHGVFVAIASAGVIFACSGFEQAVQLGGESRRPGRDIPLATIGAVGLALAVYLALQAVYIASVPPGRLGGGWDGVAFGGNAALFGPFAGLAGVLGLGWLAVVLYSGAIVSPAGTGLLYAGGSARLSYALAGAGLLPGRLARLGPTGTPVAAIALSFVAGLAVLLPFPGWQELVGFIAAAAVVAYGMAPPALAALRRSDPARPRPFRLPAAGVLAPAAFVVASEMLLFTGWAVVWKLLVAIGLGFALLAATRRRAQVTLDARGARWLWPYLAGMGIVSYLSSFDTAAPSTVPLLGLRGPRDALPFGVDVAVTAVLALAVFALAVHCRLPIGRVTERADRSPSRVG